MQGVVKSYDPSMVSVSSFGTPIWPEYELAVDALTGSIFRMLRQGQRVIFDLDDAGCARRLRLGSEVDMAAPAEPPAPA